MSTLSLNGIRKSGEDVRNENRTAISAISNIISNTLGPAGMDKVIVDHIGEPLITNDGATILKLIETQHPAAKILSELASIQDKEVGDGTTSVVILAAELIKRGNNLISKGVHPTIVINGFQQSRRMACKFLADNLSLKLNDLKSSDENILINTAKTALSSKSLGGNPEISSHFAKIAYDSLKNSSLKSIKKSSNSSNSSNLSFISSKTSNFDVKKVEIIKIRGESLRDSYNFDGIVIERHRTLNSFGMPSSLENSPKILFIDFDLRKDKLPLSVKVVGKDPNEIEAIRDEEIKSIERKIDLIISSKANVVLSSRTIEDFAMKILSSKGLIGMKNVSLKSMRRLAKATGAKVLTSLSSIDSKDCIDKIEADCLGTCDKIWEERVGDVMHLVKINVSGKGAQTVVLRGPNDYCLDEAERAFHDCLCVLEKVMKSNRIVIGGGVVETALSVYLENFAETAGNKEQLAIAEYAKSLLIIPKTLIKNGAFDVTKLISKLRSAHMSVILKGNKKFEHVGLDLEKGLLRDNFKAGVIEPAMSKIKSLKAATEAAVSILRIDDSVVMNKKPNPSHPAGY